jgi:hypothetical protein
LWLSPHRSNSGTRLLAFLHIDEKTAEWIRDAMREFENERKKGHDERMVSAQAETSRIQAEMDATFN